MPESACARVSGQARRQPGLAQESQTSRSISAISDTTRIERSARRFRCRVHALRSIRPQPSLRRNDGRSRTLTRPKSFERDLVRPSLRLVAVAPRCARSSRSAGCPRSRARERAASASADRRWRRRRSRRRGRGAARQASVPLRQSPSAVRPRGNPRRRRSLRRSAPARRTSAPPGRDSAAAARRPHRQGRHRGRQRASAR